MSIFIIANAGIALLASFYLNLLVVTSNTKEKKENSDEENGSGERKIENEEGERDGDGNGDGEEGEDVIEGETEMTRKLL